MHVRCWPAARAGAAGTSAVRVLTLSERIPALDCEFKVRGQGTRPFGAEGTRSRRDVGWRGCASRGGQCCSPHKRVYNRALLCVYLFVRGPAAAALQPPQPAVVNRQRGPQDTPVFVGLRAEDELRQSEPGALSMHNLSDLKQRALTAITGAGLRPPSQLNSDDGGPAITDFEICLEKWNSQIGKVAVATETPRQTTHRTPQGTRTSKPLPPTHPTQKLSRRES
eukprot:COSAG02_NODE_40_length_47766_cov_88.053119_17_plen_224_part_00